MDTALKQRLVGASVLVALGVIFIPMLLDGPDDPVRLPEQPDRPFEERRLRVNLPEPDSARPEPERVEPAPVPRSAEPDPDPPPATAQDQPRPSSTEPRDPPPREQPRAEAATTPAAAAQVAVAPPTAVGGSGWVLQLGSFGNRDNAQKLVDQVAAAGYNAYRDTIARDGQSLHRVRVGHWQDKADAASAGTLLGQRFADIDVSLQWDGGDQSPPDQPLRGFMVQVGAFGKESNALGLRERLRGAGYSTHVVNIKGTYRVLVGPELERPAAEASRDRLKREQQLAGIVVSHP